VLEELKRYTGILALGDLLHLGKNLRTRFLKYLLKPAADASPTRNEINSHFTLGSGSRIIRLLTFSGRSQAGKIA
jgi:hypothetical protein